jgi:hypothetical protein
MSGELPPLFRQLLWSYDFSHVDADKHRKTIIGQALNYDTLEHWRWIKKALRFHDHAQGALKHSGK